MAAMVATAATPTPANSRYVAPGPRRSCRLGSTRLTCGPSAPHQIYNLHNLGLAGLHACFSLTRNRR